MFYDSAACLYCTLVWAKLRSFPSSILLEQECSSLAKNYCYLSDIRKQCGKSCGLCAGLTPAPSTTCFDVFVNCPALALTSCYLNSTAAKCGRSCGLCSGMTPALSLTCYDKATNCAELAATSCYLEATQRSWCSEKCYRASYFLPFWNCCLKVPVGQMDLHERSTIGIGLEKDINRYRF